MSVFLTVALAAATQFQPVCSWDRPGANPYTGSTSAAIERYTDIPEQVRNTLKRRMEERQSDDQVIITRDAIVGKNQYEAAIRDMHFGAASVCTSVTRSKWSERRQEPAAVYCVGEHCILVPRICGNVSRITRLPSSRTARTAPPAAPASPERNLGDSLNARDLGLADATPLEEIPLDEAALRERDRAYARVNEVLDAVAQNDEVQASNDPNERDGQYGHRPYWPDNHHDNNGPNLPASPVPEADSWAMLLAGMAMVGYAARRRLRRR
ncbi:PEP-CTERM sorting domain-containing protein [Pseudoduganella sp. FT93W]|uniref:PEP-CTERM sorting domain-containing protein n=1 Tax=Duganella fentianensis TaxID=2692177 RepID=A0A845I349_9BURK|nr:MHFG family PEP-CTERM protein [Duganella fentianensis]MYN45556.1 PEP-CTERM sorting domain-containing protein [Duganella fentianensis]